MQDYAKLNALIDNHEYADAAVEARRMLMRDPKEPGAVSTLAKALLCMKDYAGALVLYERMDAERRADLRIPGNAGWTNHVAIIHWMMGNQAKAIGLFAQLVDGILDGSIEFGDLAGGVQQGLMLFYMGVTGGDEAAEAKAFKYLRTRVKRVAVRNFPGPVARFYLDEIDFPEMMAAATKENDQGKPAAENVASAIEIARNDILTRRFVCVALFHDGIKARARGDETHCMTRMRECFALENPLVELEWYLARHEAERR